MNFTRPDDLPDFCTDPAIIDPQSGQNNVVEPDSGNKPEGWKFQQLPPRGWMNWLHNLYYRWIGRYSQIDAIQDVPQYANMLEGLHVNYSTDKNITVDRGYFYGTKTGKYISFSRPYVSQNIGVVINSAANGYETFAALNPGTPVGMVASGVSFSGTGTTLHIFVLHHPDAAIEDPDVNEIRIGADSDISGDNILDDFAALYSVPKAEIDIRRVGSIMTIAPGGTYSIRPFLNTKNNGQFRFTEKLGAPTGNFSSTGIVDVELRIAGEDVYPIDIPDAEIVGTINLIIDPVSGVGVGDYVYAEVDYGRAIVNAEMYKNMVFANYSVASGVAMIGISSVDFNIFPTYANGSPVLRFNILGLSASVQLISFGISYLGWTDPRTDIL